MADFHTDEGWLVRSSGEYLYISRDGKPGEIIVKAECEGFVVDIWSEDKSYPDGTTSALYTDLERENDDEQGTD